MYVQDNEIIKIDAPALLPDDDSISSAVVLDDDTVELTVSGGDSGESEYSDESEDDASVSMGDSSDDISAYTLEEAEADREIIGGISQLNVTVTLILFFLLFAWVDRKIQAVMNGVSGK